MKLHPSAPIADGICFDDLHGLPDATINRFAARRIVFLTEFRESGKTYGGRIVAASWQDAEWIAFGRGLGEAIIGRLDEVGAG